MNNPTIEAIVKSTGQKVKVYKLHSGGYGLYEDGGKTTYTKEQLTLL